MFHVELRQFPHQARAFNLAREEVERRIVSRWVAGQPVELDERRWSPGRAKLTIYEAPALGADQLGLGRGWAEVTRSGREVTAEVLEGLSVDYAMVAEQMLREARSRPVSLEELAGLVGDRALAERIALELLRDGRLRLVS